MPTSKDKGNINAKMVFRTAHQLEAELSTSLPAYDHYMEEKVASNEKKYAKMPVLETLYLAEGQDGIVTMTNMTSIELDDLWGYLEVTIKLNWNIGHSCKFKPSQKMCW